MLVGRPADGHTRDWRTTFLIRQRRALACTDIRAKHSKQCLIQAKPFVRPAEREVDVISGRNVPNAWYSFLTYVIQNPLPLCSLLWDPSL